MSDVWFVEQGSYSDYRVSGVFTTEEKAQYIADKINGTGDVYRYEEASIRKVPLDPAVNELQQGLEEYQVWMLRDGTVEGCEHRPKLTGYSLGGGEPWINNNSEMMTSVFASSEEHAVKIANERRTMMIATGEWDKQVERYKE